MIALQSYETFKTAHGGNMLPIFLQILTKHSFMIADHVMVSLDFLLINLNLNLIGLAAPASIFAWAMDYWQ